MAPGSLEPQHMGTVLVTGATGNTGRSFLHAAEPYLTRRSEIREDQDLESCQGARYRWSKVIACVAPNCVDYIEDLQQEYQDFHVEFPIVDVEADPELEDVDRLKMNMEAYQPLGTVMKDVNFLFIVPSSSIRRVEHMQRYVEAAQHCKDMRLIVLVSALGADSGSNQWTIVYYRMEAVLYVYVVKNVFQNASSRKSGIPYAILRCAPFIETFFAFSQDVACGRLPLPIDQGAFAPISVLDLAHIATYIINHHERFRYWEGPVTGDEMVSGKQIAAIASDVFGFPVRYESVADTETREKLIQQGIHGWLADGVIAIFSMIAQRELEVNAASHFRQALPTGAFVTFRNFFEAHFDIFTHPSSMIASSDTTLMTGTVQFEKPPTPMNDNENENSLRVREESQLRQVIVHWQLVLNDLRSEVLKLMRILDRERDSLMLRLVDLEEGLSPNVELDQGINQYGRSSTPELTTWVSTKESEWYER